MRKVLSFTLLFLTCLSLSAFAADVDAVFSPNAGARGRIIDNINNAEKSIRVAVYKLYNKDLAKALYKASKKGVDVRIIVDGSKSMKKKSEFTSLKESGMNIKSYTPPSKGHMHHKFCVIDDKIIITGSYNWNNSAEEDNNETLLFITNDDKLTQKFIKEFEHLWKLK